MSKILDTRGGDAGPLLGRLRGVTARHELRHVVMVNEPIEQKVHDAHFAFRGDVPTPLPDFLSNSERHPVVSAALGAALVRLDATVELLPVRLVEKGGKSVADTGFVVAIVKVLEKAIDSWSKGSVGGYLFNEIKDAPEPAGPMPPLFRVAHSLAIGCNDDAAAVLQTFSGVVLTSFPDYVDVLGPPPPSPYLLWHCGTDGASFSVEGSFGSTLEEGTLDPSTWPRGGPVAKMRAPKSRKKLVDFMSGSGAPIVSSKAKAALEKEGLVDVHFLPVQAQDHDGAAVKGEHWVLYVRCTRPFIDVQESDIEVVHDLLWTAREVVVDEAALPDRPPLFRGAAGARYPWVFIRSDVAEGLEKAKLKGFRTEHPARFAHSVEGGSLPKIC